MSVSINSGDFPLMRNVDSDRQPERSKVYSAWIQAFNLSVPEAVEHLADVIEDVYAFELWKDKYLDTPEQFFDHMGILGLDLEEPAKLIKALRAKRSTKRAEIIRRAEEAKKLREQGLTQQKIAEALGVSRPTVAADLSENTVMTPKSDKEPRKTTVYQISQYTMPETAAEKIRDKFGSDYAKALKEAL